MSKSKELLCAYINEYPNMLEIGDDVLVWCDEAYRPAKISSIQVEVGIGKALKYFCTHSTISKHVQGFGLYFPNQVMKNPRGCKMWLSDTYIKKLKRAGWRVECNESIWQNSPAQYLIFEQEV